MSVNKLPEYSTVLFTQVFENESDFLKNWKESGIYSEDLMQDSSIITLYYLLYARYGNSPIANYDINQFQYKICSIIYMYGPTWEKRLDIQKKLRGLTEEDIISGSKAIYNHAFNPSAEPKANGELDFINEQNTTSHSKSKMDAYGMLWDLISTDVTNEFLTKFQGLFKKFVRPARTWIYETDLEDEE